MLVSRGSIENRVIDVCWWFEYMGRCSDDAFHDPGKGCRQLYAVTRWYD